MECLRRIGLAIPPDEGDAAPQMTGLAEKIASRVAKLVTDIGFTKRDGPGLAITCDKVVKTIRDEFPITNPKDHLLRALENFVRSQFIHGHTPLPAAQCATAPTDEDDGESSVDEEEDSVAEVNGGSSSLDEALAGILEPSSNLTSMAAFPPEQLERAIHALEVDVRASAAQASFVCKTKMPPFSSCMFLHDHVHLKRKLVPENAPRKSSGC